MIIRNESKHPEFDGHWTQDDVIHKFYCIKLYLSQQSFQSMPSDKPYQQNFPHPGMAGSMMISKTYDPNNTIESLKSMLHDTANKL